MTDDEFKGWTRHFAENVLAQRDDALARVEKMDAGQSDLLAAHAAALKAKDDELVAAKEAAAVAAKRVAELQVYDGQFQKAERDRLVADKLARGDALVAELAALGFAVELKR